MESGRLLWWLKARQARFVVTWPESPVLQHFKPSCDPNFSETRKVLESTYISEPGRYVGKTLLFSIWLWPAVRYVVLSVLSGLSGRRPMLSVPVRIRSSVRSPCIDIDTHFKLLQVSYRIRMDEHECRFESILINKWPRAWMREVGMWRVPYPTFGIHVCKMNPTHDAGKKDRQKEAHTHIHPLYALLPTDLTWDEKQTFPQTISDPCMPPKWGWVRDENLDGVVKLEMPKDYKPRPSHYQGIKPQPQQLWTAKQYPHSNL